MTSVYPSSVTGKSIIKYLALILSLCVLASMVITVLSVTFVDTVIVNDATWNSEEQNKGVFYFTVLNSQLASNKNQPDYSLIRKATLYLLSAFKNLWVTATGKECRPFLYIRDSGNNCLLSHDECQEVWIKNFDTSGNLENQFSFLTTAQAVLIAQCSLPSPASRLLPGAVMVFYGFSCESPSEQRSCERQSLVHTYHRLNYVVY